MFTKAQYRQIEKLESKHGISVNFEKDHGDDRCVDKVEVVIFPDSATGDEQLVYFMDRFSMNFSMNFELDRLEDLPRTIDSYRKFKELLMYIGGEYAN